MNKYRLPVIAICMLGILALLAAFLWARWSQKADAILYLTTLSDQQEIIALLDPRAPSCSPPRSIISDKITDANTTVTLARWSPKRDQIIYSTYSLNQKTASLWTVRRDGSQQKQLLSALPQEVHEISLSANQRYAAFISLGRDTTDTSAQDVVLLDLETGITRTLLTFATTFTWSPIESGVMAIYRSGALDDAGLYVVQPDGKILGQYHGVIITSSALVWSPDGKEIAYSSHFSSQEQLLSGITTPEEIYAIDVKSGEQKQITHSGGQYKFRLISSFSWSPDGNRVVFVSDYSKHNEAGKINVLSILDVDSGREVELTDHLEASAPVWSPDGSQIAFISKKDGSSNAQVYTMDVGSMELKQLTCDEEMKLSLSW